MRLCIKRNSIINTYFAKKYMFSLKEQNKNLKEYIFAFVSTLILGFIAYFPIAIYLPYNSDTLSIGENKEIYSFYISASGRFFRAIFELFSNLLGLNITIPVFQVVIGILILSISVTIIAYLLKIKKVISQILLSSIIVLSCYSEIFLFIHDIIAYTFSILLSLIALIFFNNMIERPNLKFINRILNIIFISIFLIIAIGIYQISIIYFISIYFLILISKIYNNEKFNDILQSLLLFVFVCFISLIVYFLILNIFHSNALYSRGVFLGINRIIKVYGSILAMPFITYAGINYSLIVKLSIFTIYVVLFCFFITLFIKIVPINKLILLLLIISFPVVINIAMLLETNTSFRTLHGMIFLIIFPLWIINNTKILNQTKKILYVSIILIAFFNFYYTETRILSEKNACESTKAYLIEMVSKIKSLENYSPKQKVALMSSNRSFFLENFEDYHTYSNYFDNPTYLSCLVASWGIDEAFKVFAGYNIKLASDEEIKLIKIDNEFLNMQTYPYSNSIKIIDDIIVIKLD